MFCKYSPKHFKEAPVTSSICFILISMFVLYSTVIKKEPCGIDMKSLFLRNFVTNDMVELIINIFSLYSLASIEIKLGSYKFLNLVVLSVILNTILEWYVHKKYDDHICSLGFTNITVTLIVFSFMTSKIININTMTLLILIMIIFTLQKENKKGLVYIDAVIIGWLLFWFFKPKTSYS